jgi:hypothetical protein
MNSSTFLIGPLLKDGLRKDVKPHAIPEDAWESLVNIFQFRGRMIRHYGYTSLDPAVTTTRLSTDGGTTFPGLPVMGLKNQDLFGIGLQNLVGFDTKNAYTFNGTTWSILPSVLPVVPPIWSGTNSQFFWTVNYAGAFWVTNSKPGITGWAVTLFSGSAGVGNAATVQVTAAGNTVAVGDQVYFLNLAGGGAANNLAFGIVTVAGNPTFTIRATNATATFTWTNGVVTGLVLDSLQSISGQDGIRYYAATSVGNTWVNYNPPIDPNTALMGALMIFPYRGYLVFLNTTEGNATNIFNNFPNRARWTQIGTPYYSQPVPTTPSAQTQDPLAVRDDIFGRGGASDAPTGDVIVGAEFIRDILVVYFTKSTWRLRFVNNSQNPFVWERVNRELGSSSTFSTIVFDKALMAIGTRGIISSDGNDTIRFDQKIPDEAFNIRIDNEGLQRVYGIRTFQSKFCYWTVGDSSNPLNTFPDRVLAYNYDSQTWSYFDDSFTCFGYYSGSTTGYTWNDLIDNWSSYDMTWDAGFTQAGYETVIAGNQQGFVFALEQTDGQNSPSLVLTNITNGVVTSTDHNLADQSWITLTGVSGVTYTDGVSLNGRNFKIAVNTANTFTLMEYKPMYAGNVSGVLVTYTVGYVPIVPGTVQINIGTIQFLDTNADGNLISSGPGTNSGTINYETGLITLNFNPSLASTAMIIRLSSFDPLQTINVISTTTADTPGFITKISNFSMVSKIFNFFRDDKRSRLSKIDFYTALTANGQFTCNVYGDSTDEIINMPLPDNLESNVVPTSQNVMFPNNQLYDGQENISRLYCDATAETIQLELTMSNQQMSSTAINSSNFELNSLMVTMKRGGRLV